MKPRWGWLLVAVLWLHQVAIALLSPLSAEDWKVRIDGPQWPTLGGLYHWLIVDSRVAHVALTPLLVVALPLGLATLARGRRLRPGDDTVLVAMIASLLWLAVPDFGLACSYRLVVATQVVGLVAALWYVAAFRAVAGRARAGEPISTRTIAGLALAGAVAGATTRPVSTVTLVACAVIAVRARDHGARRWAIAGLGGLAVGSAVAWLSDLTAMLDHVGHDINGELHDFDALTQPPIWVGAATTVLWIAHAAWRRWRGHTAMSFTDNELDAIGRGIALAVALAVLGLVTTEFTSFQVVAPGAVVAAVAATTVVGLAGGGRARLVLFALALALQARVITGSVRALIAARRAFDDRVVALAHAPRGSIATVVPYDRHAKTWFFGEDFRFSLLRDRVATRVFGLRGIALAPARYEFQDVPALALHHEVDGDAGGFPDFYSADLATAREQFAAAVARRPGAARLVVDGIAVPDRPGVPVLAAWTRRDGRAAWWRLEQRDLDLEGQLRLVPRSDDLEHGAHADGVVAMWSFDLATGASEALGRGDDGSYRLRPGRRILAGVVACSAARCALAEVIGL